MFARGRKKVCKSAPSTRLQYLGTFLPFSYKARTFQKGIYIMGNKAQSRLPKSCYRLPTTSLQLIYHANILFKRHLSDFEVTQL